MSIDHTSAPSLPTDESALQALGERMANQRRDTSCWLVETGEMADLIRAMNWSATPLGPLNEWPENLRALVSLCLSTNVPMSLAWGPQHNLIYNDAYRPVCGSKHPQSLGQPIEECWSEAWPTIGTAFDRALAGEVAFLENQRLFLDRNGYPEETFFTFSFSPIRDGNGVAGIFNPAMETTGRRLSDRRARLLHDVSAQTAKAQTADEACELTARILVEYPLDTPFALFYLLDERRTEARLTASVGLALGSAAAPSVVRFETRPGSGWPLAQVAIHGKVEHIKDVEARFGPLPCGEYPESVREAMVLPITPPGARAPVAILIVGAGSRVQMHRTYRNFFDLLAAGLASAIAKARAHQNELKRSEALAAIDRAKTEFFSNVSHELRTPLTLILGLLEGELAEPDDPLSAARREHLATAHRNSLRLLKLVNSLLDFSRIEAGREPTNYRPTDLARLTAELASVFRSTVEKAGLTLEVDCPPLPEPVYVDVEMWEKVVLNLLSNAFKYTFDGSIRVTLRWRGDHARLTVKDTGVGIPQAELPRLFERFHRVQGAKSRTHEGTGIGLALVRELILLHGGKVEIESEEGQGSSFIVTVKTGNAHLPENLPSPVQAGSTATRAAAYVSEAQHWTPDGNANETDQPLSQKPDAGARRSRIVWVDDNADMREYVRRLLADRYEVIAVADGLAALSAIQEKQPDLVLSDVMMAGLDGFGLLRELRSDPQTRTIPVILLSARAGEEAAVAGWATGADDYLAKPFSAQELLARVHTHLELQKVRKEWATELEHANKELEAFSYSVSHDLRAPLRAIDGFSKALLDNYAGRLDQNGCHYLQRVRTATQKMSGLIDDLLNLSRMSRGVLRKQPVDLTAMARDIIAELQSRDAKRAVSIEIEDGLSAHADLRLLTIVLDNLLGNAWKYSGKRADAKIVFGRESCDGAHVFYVRDNGAGFDMAYANKLFVPFQRLHHESDFEGTGVGLATVQRIISRHGGRIWAEAAPNQGATFYFTLGDAG